MNKKLSFIFVAAVLVLSHPLLAAVEAAKTSSEEGAAVRYVIGLSPFLEDTVKDDLFRRTIGFILQDVPLNSSVVLYDAYNLKTITRLTVPDVRAFRSPKTRANQFAEPIRELKSFLAQKHERPDTGRLKLQDAVRFPQFMDFLAENLSPSDQPPIVLVFGSPLYLDPKEPSFSMVDGYFPSDGHLQASRDKSLFAVKDRAGALKGVTVHFGFFGDPWVSEVHHEKIARFWTLYLQEQGARLATFCGDPATLFSSVSSGGLHTATKACQIDPAQTKVEMLRITRDVSVADWITRDVLPHTELGPPSHSVGPMKIGIRWRGNIDLDLYATPRPGGETLYFEHTRIPEGYYFKDHRSSPEREYEFIEFESPVDVRSVEAAVNFYKGNSDGGAAGEVRIEFDGKIYTGQFSIPAEHGNRGRSAANQSEYWTRIDVCKILKLDSTRQAASR